MNELNTTIDKFEVVLLTLKKLVQTQLKSNPQSFRKVHSILQDIMALFEEHAYSAPSLPTGDNIHEFTPDNFQMALRELKNGQSIAIGIDTSRASEFDYFLVPTQGCFSRPEEISKIHAVIYCEDRQCWLTDCGSTNGTFHNGHFVKPKVEFRLISGDMLSFGARERSYMYIKTFDTVDEPTSKPKSVWQTLLAKSWC